MLADLVSHEHAAADQSGTGRAENALVDVDPAQGSDVTRRSDQRTLAVRVSEEQPQTA